MKINIQVNKTIRVIPLLKTTGVLSIIPLFGVVFCLYPYTVLGLLILIVCATLAGFTLFLYWELARWIYDKLCEMEGKSSKE